MYEFFLTLLVTSDEHPDGSEQEFIMEFDDAEDDGEAIVVADWLLDEYMGVVGVKDLLADGFHHPVIEDYIRADLYCEHRKVADLATGLFDLGESVPLTKKYAGRPLPRHINEILGEPKYG